MYSVSKFVFYIDSRADNSFVEKKLKELDSLHHAYNELNSQCEDLILKIQELELILNE